MILPASILESGDMRLGKLVVHICLKIKAAVEAMVKAEVIFFKKVLLRDSISCINSKIVNCVIS